MGKNPTTKLSDTQAIILSAATQRSDGNVLPLPGSLRGGAAGKVVTALLTRGLIREHVTESLARADAALNTVWRNEDDGRAVLLRVTPAGLKAIGVAHEPEHQDPGDGGEVPDTDPADEPADSAPTGAAGAEAAPRPATRSRSRIKAPPGLDRAAPRKTREGTKQAQLIAMLERAEGATIEQIVAATGWQPHTVRGAFAGALKKKLGLIVTSKKVEGRGRVYRLGH